MYTRVDPPEPVEVLHDGRWFVGQLYAWSRIQPDRRSGSWRAFVRYSTAPSVGYTVWLPSEQVRRL